MQLLHLNTLLVEVIMILIEEYMYVYLDAYLPLANTGQPSIIDSGFGGLSHLDNLNMWI